MKITIENTEWKVTDIWNDGVTLRTQDGRVMLISDQEFFKLTKKNCEVCADKGYIDTYIGDRFAGTVECVICDRDAD